MTEEQDGWLEEQAERRDRSKSYIASECIDAIRTDEHHGDAQPTDETDFGELREEIQEVKALLEADVPRIDANGGDEHHTDEQRVEPVNGDANRVDGEEDGHSNTQTERARRAFNQSGFDAEEEYVDALVAVLNYAEANGSVTMKEALENVMLDGHAAGYDTTSAEEYLDPDHERDRYRGAWWRNIADALEELPEVESPPKGGSKWKFTS